MIKKWQSNLIHWQVVWFYQFFLLSQDKLKWMSFFNSLIHSINFEQSFHQTNFFTLSSQSGVKDALRLFTIQPNVPISLSHEWYARYLTKNANFGKQALTFHQSWILWLRNLWVFSVLLKFAVNNGTHVSSSDSDSESLQVSISRGFFCCGSGWAHWLLSSPLEVGPGPFCLPGTFPVYK